MRWFRNLLIALAAAAVVLAAAGYVALRNGLSADTPPGRLETAVARRLVRLSIPRAARQLPNPHASDQDAWRHGAEHFADHCASCHGADGRGATELGARMYPPVPNLAASDIQALTDGELFAIIQHGVRWTGMPAFRSEHSDDETWRLVSFIRRLPALKPEGQRHTDSESRDHVSAVSKSVAIDGTAFNPVELMVHVGDVVAWKNTDPFPHNVTSSVGGFSSGDLEPDVQWRWRARTAGRFPYVCTLHPGMKGTLIVEP
jgi:plastocyanin